MNSTNTKVLKEAFESWRKYTSLNERPEPELVHRAALNTSQKITKQEGELLGFFWLAGTSKILEEVFLVDLSLFNQPNLEEAVKPPKFKVGPDGLERKLAPLAAPPGSSSSTLSGTSIIRTSSGLYTITQVDGKPSIAIFTGNLDDNIAILSMSQYINLVQKSKIDENEKTKLLSQLEVVQTKSDGAIEWLGQEWHSISKFFDTGIEDAAASIANLENWRDVILAGVGAMGTYFAGVGAVNHIFRDYFSTPRVQARMGVRAMRPGLKALKGVGADLTGNIASDVVGFEDFKTRLDNEVYRSRRGMSRPTAVPDITLPNYGFTDEEFLRQTRGRPVPYKLVRGSDDVLRRELRPASRFGGAPGINPGGTSTVAGREFNMSGPEVKVKKEQLVAMADEFDLQVSQANTKIENVYDDRGPGRRTNMPTARVGTEVPDLKRGATVAKVRNSLEASRDLAIDKAKFVREFIKTIEEMSKNAPGRGFDERNILNSISKLMANVVKSPFKAVKFLALKAKNGFLALGLPGRVAVGVITFVGVLAAKDLIDGYMNALGAELVAVIATAMAEIPFLEGWTIGYLEDQAIIAQKKLIAAKGNISEANLDDLQKVIIASMKIKLEKDAALRNRLLARAEESEKEDSPWTDDDAAKAAAQPSIDRLDAMFEENKNSKLKLKIILG